MTETMEYEIVELGAFSVLGLMERMAHEGGDYAGIWDRFMRYHSHVYDLSRDKAYYGVSFPTGDEDQTDYLAGMAVYGVDEAPEGLTLREASASRYAVFQCTVETIPDTYERIFGEWLPEAPYERPPSGSAKADFERYPPLTGTPDTAVLIHIALDG